MTRRTARTRCFVAPSWLALRAASVWAACLVAGLGLVGLAGLAPPAAAQDADPAASETATSETNTSETNTSETNTETTTETSVPGALRVALEPTEVTVGGRVKATLTLVWMGETLDAPPRFPAFADGWGDAEVLESSEVESFTDDVGRSIYRQVLELASFRPGRVELPAPRVAVPLTERTVDVSAQVPADAPLAFEVVSVLPSDEADAEAADPDEADAEAGTEAATEASTADPFAPRPPAPPVRLERGLTFPITLAALLALLALSVWRLLVALERAPALDAEAGDAAPVDPLSLLPPLEELRRRLAGIDPSRPEPAHTAISLALRTYLGRRLRLQAIEATTTEIQRRLRDEPLDPDTARRAVGLLRACDRAKFAGETVPAETTARRVDETSSIAVAVDGMLRRDESTDAAPPREAAA